MRVRSSVKQKNVSFCVGARILVGSTNVRVLFNFALSCAFVQAGNLPYTDANINLNFTCSIKDAAIHSECYNSWILLAEFCTFHSVHCDIIVTD